jgi:hypothetical protein
VGAGNVTVNISPTIHNLNSIAGVNITGGSGTPESFRSRRPARKRSRRPTETRYSRVLMGRPRHQTPTGSRTLPAPSSLPAERAGSSAPPAAGRPRARSTWSP